MMVTYGHQVTSANDKFVALAEAVREHGERTPASNIVDIFPICRHRRSRTLSDAPLTSR